MGRAVSREEVFKLVFEFSMNKERNEMLLEEILEANSKDKDYINLMYHNVTSHYDELLEEIANASNSFKIDRIYKVDLALILLALAEIKYMDEIPAPVSVNEALNLAKKYSTEKSTSFINGVLSRFVKSE